jgi:hypothetical protein
MDGISTLQVSETAVTGATFNTAGAFIVGNSRGSINCTVSLSSTNFSSLSGTSLNGTVIRVDGVITSVLIENCNFGPSMNAGNGGALYLADCSTRIISSNFTGCAASTGGRGGAIYFGLETSFSLNGSRFTTCSATYGGAIYCNSEELTERRMNEVTFSANTVGTGGNGNDIADESAVATSLYSPLTVTNCLSTSVNSTSVSNFILLQGSVTYDCLLASGGCLSGVLYVTSSGTDSVVCGLSSLPCRSVTQAAYNLNISSGSEGDINVASGEYTDTYLSISSINLVVASTTETKPVLSLVSPGSGLLFSYLSMKLFFTTFILFIKVCHQW